MMKTWRCIRGGCRNTTHRMNTHPRMPCDKKLCISCCEKLYGKDHKHDADLTTWLILHEAIALEELEWQSKFGPRRPPTADEEYAAWKLDLEEPEPPTPAEKEYDAWKRVMDELK